MGRLRTDSIEGDFLEQAADWLWRNWRIDPRELHSGALGWWDVSIRPVQRHRGYRRHCAGLSLGQGNGFVLERAIALTVATHQNRYHRTGFLGTVPSTRIVLPVPVRARS
jgi:hypothetical protein